MKFYINDINSQNKFSLETIIKRKYRIPNILPIVADIQHGWYSDENFFGKVSDKNKLQLVWNKRMKIACDKFSLKNTVIIGAPFIWFRKINNLNKVSNQSGTIVFPQHSTEGSLLIMDHEKFIKKLLNLPQEFHPITICLYYPDFLDDKVRTMYNKFFTVITNGDIYSSNFPKLFYENLIKFKYSASNSIGTYTFYSIEIGIPFFIVDQSFSFVPRINENTYEAGSNNLINYNLEYSRIYKLFKYSEKVEITNEQRDYCASELGFKNEYNYIYTRLLLICYGLIYFFKFKIKNIFLR